ncbi:MAG: hypothetical protein GFH27_549279n241 [Chloroflexi bacterium AL-W]|nr:hypothetical protein [Chloroflexi bacterium AL-N1]NOK65207.1 hypothetical protein [Chloroflexi bacterium AL-N10]NOK72528.1 hypothetical protein [Chloroflexi bacterium AL-N5]NOK79386.1 hypothetical protein [Chloroflexi bacterium AL-W]NOK87302.1 hypothetical protein [Chloroflexi bacterium AL-N15]
MSEHIIDRCIELQARIAAYAIGQSDSDPELIEHLASCESCHRDFHIYAEIAYNGPEPGSAFAPPPGMRRRVINTIVTGRMGDPEGRRPRQ